MTFDPRMQRLCLWAAPVGLVFTFTGMLVAGWLPPAFPGDSAAEVGRYYREHADAIRITSIMITIGGVLLVPTIAVVSLYVTRMEGTRGPLSYVQLLSGVIGPLAFIVPCFLWQAAAFDPGRSDEITKALHDAAWLAFIAGIWSFALQNLAVACAILRDGSDEPILPRWLGYFGVWAALLYTPSCLVLFFKDGPFAWNGIFTFWLAAIAFVAWNLTLIVQLQRVILRESARAV
jgi:hypothetical protein